MSRFHTHLLRTAAWLAAVCSAFAPGLAAQTPTADAPVRLELNIPRLRLVVYERNQPTRSYPVSVGLPKHPTPTGDFQLSRAEWNPWWHPPDREWARKERPTPPASPRNPMGRVKLFFLPLYFIHGTSEEKALGSPASHGCIRMRNRDVTELGRRLHAVGGAAPATLAGIDSALKRPRTTRRTVLPTPIPFRIVYQPVVVENGKLVFYPDVYGLGRVHPVTIHQALVAAGHDPRLVRSEQLTRLAERARAHKGVLSVPLDTLFTPAAASAALPGGRH